MSKQRQVTYIDPPESTGCQHREMRRRWWQEGKRCPRKRATWYRQISGDGTREWRVLRCDEHGTDDELSGGGPDGAWTVERIAA